MDSNPDLEFWIKLEHDDWKLVSFSSMEHATFTRPGTDANGTPVPNEFVTISKTAMWFVSRALHFMEERQRENAEN